MDPDTIQQEKQTSSSQEALGTAPITSLMVKMAIPGILAQLINILYNIIDRIYIGHIAEAGSYALTGVGLTFPILTFISAFAVIVGAGGAPLASIELGRKNRENAETILGTGVFLLLLFSALVMIVFYVFKEPLLIAFGASNNTLPYADRYLSVYLLGTCFVMTTLGLNQYIIIQGKPIVAMCSVGIGAVINLILDPIFIFVFNWSVKGAALATIIAQAASAAWILRTLFLQGTSLSLKLSKITPNAKWIRSIIALGISPFIMTSTESLISIVINRGLYQYGGDLYVGSFTIIQSVMQMMGAPISGFTQGVQPIISYNYGAGNNDRVRATYRRLIGACVVFESIFTTCIMLWPGIFAAMFAKDADLIALVCRVMPIFICGMLIFGLQNGIQTTFVGLGQAKISLFIAVLRKLILLIPLAIILPHFFGVMGVYYAEPISDILSATTATTLFLINIRKILDKSEHKQC